jgi:hypothetical protein
MEEDKGFAFGAGLWRTQSASPSGRKRWSTLARGGPLRNPPIWICTCGWSVPLSVMKPGPAGWLAPNNRLVADTLETQGNEKTPLAHPSQRGV